MDNSYKHTMKATVVLSSAQMVEAVISLVRAKIIAVLLGPMGIAINSILQTTVNTLYQVTGFGIPQSGVREISKAHCGGDANSLAAITTVFRCLILVSAFIGLLVCLLSSQILSDLSFGQADDHSTDFIILSIGFFFLTLSYGNITLLQGTQRLLYLAKSTMLTAFISLLIGVPFFFWLGNKGIAYAISLGYIVAFCINSLYVGKLHIKRIHFPVKTIIKIASPIIKLGLTIMVSYIIINLFTYFTNVLIRYFGSLQDVGLFQSGYALTNRNFAILSGVLVADYYPRLSGLIDKKADFDRAVSEQAELLLLIISAVSVLIIVFCPWIIKILLSNEFLVISNLVRLIAFSFVFRIIWLTLSYVALAKGDKKTYLVYDAIIGNGSYFVLNIVFYYLWGMDGIGVSCVIGTLLVSLMFLLVYGKKYRFKYSRKLWKVQLWCTVFLSFFMFSQLIDNKTLYLVVTIMLGAVFSIYLYKALNSRLNLKQLIRQRFAR